MIPLNIILIIAVIVMVIYFWPSPNLGAIPACVSEGGIVNCSYRVSLMGGTSTPCSVRSPNASSTIEHASVRIGSAATTTLLVEIGKASNSGATTTSLGFMTLAANALGTLVSSSTNDADRLLISPNNYVNIRFGRESGYASSYNGNCEVIFRVIS